jgi:S-adenosylhomocysteine hydrolase
MDDGADVVGMIHSKHRPYRKLKAEPKKTTTGVVRLKAMEARRQPQIFPS